MSSYVKVFAPATVANVGPGYDIFGFAVSEPGDIVELWKTDEPGVRIKDITGDDGRLPREPEQNSAGIVVLKLLEKLGVKDFGFDMVLHKNMPLGSGMGSSAASSVAATVAANKLTGEKLHKPELLKLCMEGERIACGSAHADNVGPALYGGVIMIRSYDPIDVVSLPVPEDLYCVIVSPDFEVRTEDARKAINDMIPLKDAIHNWANTAAIVAALYEKNYELLGRAIDDKIIEPSRAGLIKGFDSVKSAAKDAGALGCSISGAGPSIFALTKSEARGKSVSDAMQKVWNDLGVQTKAYLSKVNVDGARVEEIS